MKIGVILGTIREGRLSERLAIWVVDNVKKLKNVDVELLDLRDYPMPFFNEPRSPKYNPDRQTNKIAKTWLNKLNEQDAYIIVTPEYNHSMTGVLKNALDYTDWQVSKKPFAIVSHGSAGGARAAAHIKNVISEIRGIVISSNLAITMRVGDIFDEKGTLSVEVAKQEYGPHVTLHNMLEELIWYAAALKAAK